MKRALILGLIILCGCGGTLTEEQRKKAKKDMEDHAIKKISEAEIIETSFSIGRKFADLIESTSTKNKNTIDLLEKAYQIKFVSLTTSSHFSSEPEKQIIEAYAMATDKDQLTDNVQKIGTDSLLFTKPILRELPDGSFQFVSALAIKMSRKNVVLSIK